MKGLDRIVNSKNKSMLNLLSPRFLGTKTHARRLTNPFEITNFCVGVGARRIVLAPLHSADYKYGPRAAAETCPRDPPSKGNTCPKKLVSACMSRSRNEETASTIARAAFSDPGKIQNTELLLQRLQLSKLSRMA